MPRGASVIDVRKDESHTVIKKMDARATHHIGRGKNHIVAMENAKELRMLQNAKRMTVATMSKEEREMRKRMVHLKSLLDETRHRKKPNENVQARDGGDSGHKTQETTFRPSGVRGENTFTDLSRKGRELYLTRTLTELDSTYDRHRELTYLTEEKTKQMKENLKKMGEDKAGLRKTKVHRKKEANAVNNEIQSSDDGEGATGKDGPISSIEITNTMEKEEDYNVFGNKGHLPTLSLSFPEIPKTLPKRTSLSQLISSGQFTVLPAINDPRRLKSSPTACHADEIEDTEEMHPQVRNDSLVPRIGEAMSYYQIPIQINSFSAPHTTTKPTRSRDLIDAKKNNEMYVWLGFESENEMKEKQRVRSSSPSSSSSNSSDDESENTDDDTIMENRKELTKCSTLVKQPSKLGAPVTISGHKNGERNPFSKAAMAILVIRQFQMNIKS